MILLARVFLVSLIACMAAIGPSSHAADASGWAEGHRSRVRLIAGGAEGQDRWAGIEIALDAGFKTYWRSPGESGLPPSFDWSRSENIDTLDLLWPAPKRLEDASGVSYGYAGAVVLPVRVKAHDPSKPIRLALATDYGVCKDICIPAHADLSLDLPEQAEPPFSALIQQARARVPEGQALGAESDLSVLSLVPIPGGRPHIAVSVRAPARTTPRLFVEGPDDWFFAAPETMTSIKTCAGNVQGTFRLEVDPPPNGAAGAVPLRLTLVAGDRAIETTASLDANQLSR